MSVRPRGATVLVALLLATLAACAAPALASPVTATIRVEGLTGTVIPTTTLATDARPIVSTCCDTATEKHVGEAHGFTVPSALTLVADAAAANGLSLGCTWSVVYSDCFVDGFPAAFPVGATDYWRLVVNGKDSPTGFAGTALHDGDRVDVIATDYTARSEPPLLTLTPSPAAVHTGVTFSVKVTSLDTSGFGTTGPGAANPKAVVFFLAFMPQFIRPDRPLLPQYAVLAATVVAIDVVVMWFFFAAAAKGLSGLTRSASGQRALNRVFGGLFVGVGVLLAAIH